MCGIKVDYALSTWSQCWTRTRRDRRVRRRRHRGGHRPRLRRVDAHEGRARLEPRLHPRRPRRPQNRGNPDAPRGQRARREPVAHRLLERQALRRYGLGADPRHVQVQQELLHVGSRQVCRHAHGDGGGRPSRRSRTARATRSTSTPIPCSKEAPASWASGFGTEIGYIHTGLDQWSLNGTTFAISKKGSGLPALLNPCIDKVVQTLSPCRAINGTIGAGGGPLYN